MFAISVHFSERFLTENQNFKERASLDPEATDLFLRRLRETGISESVYLMAGDCCEIYGVGRSSRATKAFARFTGIDVSTLRENLLVYENLLFYFAMLKIIFHLLYILFHKVLF